MDDYRPKYHFTAKKGWINDPNGFVYFNNKYHLFYQNYPDGTWPGPMCWGHAISDDLVSFDELPQAIHPVNEYDIHGCWSGSSAIKENTLHMLYTGNLIINDLKEQTQNLVISKDGLTFKKYDANPVISKATLPEKYTHHDFRDPSMYKYNNTYYCLLGCQTKAGVATLLRYKSKDLYNWNFDKELFESNELGYMIECPSSSFIDDKQLFIFSPQGLSPKGENYWNVYSSIYSIQKKNPNRLDLSKYYEIDNGLDFYAPTFCYNSNIMIAWMQIWERNLPLNELNIPWVNTMTLPRVISIKRNRMIQKPIESLANYFVNKQTNSYYVKDEKVVDSGLYKHLKLQFQNGSDLTLKFFKKDDKFAKIYFENGYLYIDRNDSEFVIKSFKQEKSSCNYRKVKLSSKNITLDVYLDRICVEVYINNGSKVMSMMVYNKQECDEITLSSKQGIDVIYESEDFK